MSEELRNEIREVLQEHQLSCLATFKEGKPWVRYVMTTGDDDLNLFIATGAESRKVGQIRAKSDVHVALGASPTAEKPYVQIAGRAEVVEDLEVKKQYWEDYLSRFFKGPDDPDYVVVKVVPSVIELMKPGSMQPEILAL